MIIASLLVINLRLTQTSLPFRCKAILPPGVQEYGSPGICTPTKFATIDVSNGKATQLSYLKEYL